MFLFLADLADLADFFFNRKERNPDSYRDTQSSQSFNFLKGCKDHKALRIKICANLRNLRLK